MAKSKEFMYVDVEQEVKRENLFLGRTKARRVEQKEICVIGGMPISFPYKTFDICLPDFSEEWQYDGMDNEGRKVDCHGVTQREYNSRKRKIENSDDTPKAWRENYKKFCKYNERSINYVVNACFKNRNDSYNFQSLFYK